MTHTAELLSYTHATIPRGERLGGRHDGEVFADAQLGNTALKLFHHGDPLNDMPGTLIELRANVAMAYGLPRIRQHIPEWNIRAPALYGAFLPREALTDGMVQEVQDRYCFTGVSHDYDVGQDNGNLLVEDRHSLVLIHCHAFPD